MKKIACMILAAAAAACAREPDTEHVALSDVPVCVGIGIGRIEASARTPFADIATGTTSPIKVRGMASLSGTNFSSLYANGAISFAAAATQGESSLAGVKGFDTKVYYPINPATQVWVAGLYPENSWSSSGGSQYGRPMYPYDDIMTSLAVPTTKAQALAGVYRNLSMHHRLTLLTVQVMGASSSSSDAWGKLQRIVLTGVKSPTTGAITAHPTRFIVNLATNAVSFGTETQAFTLCIPGTDTGFYGQSVTIETTPKAVAYGIFQPVTVASQSETVYTMEVTTTKATVSVPITLSTTGSTEGKSYVITITFGPAYELHAGATVTPWAEGTTGSGSATF